MKSLLWLGCMKTGLLVLLASLALLAVLSCTIRRYGVAFYANDITKEEVEMIKDRVSARILPGVPREKSYGKTLVTYSIHGSNFHYFWAMIQIFYSRSSTATSDTLSKVHFMVTNTGYRKDPLVHSTTDSLALALREILLEVLGDGSFQGGETQ